MNSAGPSDVSPEAMQARIQQARREAESLKDRIKRKKDELADTSRTSLLSRLTAPAPAIWTELHGQFSQYHSHAQLTLDLLTCVT
jgi:hypothetical protein